MTRNQLTRLLLLLVSIAPILQGQVPGSAVDFEELTVADLAASGRFAGQVYIVTDGNSTDDCTVGGGTDRVWCEWDGSAWSAFGGGSGAPVDAQYWLGAADATLSAEIVVNDLASLESAVSAYDFSDASNLDTGDLAAARMATNIVSALGTASQSATVDVYDFRCFDQTASTGSSDCTFRAGAGQGTSPILTVEDVSGKPILKVEDGENTFWSHHNSTNRTGDARSVIIGNRAGDSGTGGTDQSVLLGHQAMIKLTTGNFNTALGANTCNDLTTGANNTCVGYATAASSTYNGDGSVFLGNFAGSHETGSNKLFIDNQSRGSEAAGRTDALIYGLFDATPSNQELHLNSQVFVTHGLTVQDTTPTIGDTLFICKGGAGETGNCLEIQNNAGTVTAGITEGGEAVFKSVSAIRYCDQFTDLQACHDDLPAGGGMMIVPAGTYTLTSQLDLNKSNLTIQCAGIGNTIIQRGTFSVDAETVAISGSKTVVRDCTFDGNAETTGWALVKFFSTASDSVFQRNEIFEPIQIGLNVSASRVKVLDNFIVGNAATGSTNNFGIWHDLTAVEDLLIANNHIRGMAANAIFGSGVRITIRGNHILDNHYNTGPGGGQIALDDSSDVLIEGNTIGPGGGTSTSGIELDAGAGPAGQRITINANTIRGQNWQGIATNSSGIEDLIISNNIISNSGTAGVNQPAIDIPAGMSGFQIVGNRIFDDQGTPTQTYAVEIAAGASNNYIINDNDFRGNKTGAINDGGTGTTRTTTDNLPSNCRVRWYLDGSTTAAQGEMAGDSDGDEDFDNCDLHSSTDSHATVNRTGLWHVSIYVEGTSGTDGWIGFGALVDDVSISPDLEAYWEGLAEANYVSGTISGMIELTDAEEFSLEGNFGGTGGSLCNGAEDNCSITLVDMGI